MQIDVASILAIGLLLVVVFLAIRGGKAGPSVDRALVKEHAKLKNRIDLVERDLKGCATGSDIAVLTAKIDELEKTAVTAADINALEGKVNVIGSQIAAVEKAADRTEAGVQRIEGYLMQRGLER